MEELFFEFNRTHNNLKVEGKPFESRELAYRILEKGERPDLIFIIFPKDIKNLLFPEYIDWFVEFGEDEIVLAYTQKGKYAKEINEDNWYEIISKEDVDLGRPEENLSSLGYSTLWVWQLAERFYRKEGLYRRLIEKSQNHIYPSESQLISSLKSLDLDFAFVYLSSAKTFDLKIIHLPKEIDLSKREFQQNYQCVSVLLPGKDRFQFIPTSGSFISYAFSVPKNISYSQRRPYIKEFLKLFFSDKAKETFKKYYLNLSPINFFGEERIPQEIKDLCH